jgi:membrane-associated phospholipid phosphatase
VGVHFGLLTTFDSAIRELMRPDDVWGTTQLRADYVVEGLRPAVVISVLAAYTVVVCVVRRSLRPGLFVGVIWLMTAAMTVAVKIAMARPDPHGIVGGHGGSFPSGHTISVVVCLGLAVLVAKPRLGRWIWIPLGLAGTLMGAALLVQAAHWSTDVLGGGLLAIGVLAAASVSGWCEWSLGAMGDRRVADRGGPNPESSAPNESVG